MSTVVIWVKPMACPSKRSKKAFVNGVRKVNIDTDLRLAATGALRRFFANEQERI
jgi:fructose-bisphosphate aldolase class II